MNEQLKALIQLRDIDKAIRILTRRTDESRKRLQVREANLAGQKKLAEEKRKGIEHERMKIAKRELALKTEEAEIEKLEGQLREATTNKEYAVLRKGIEGRKADISLIEDEVLAMMAEIDELEDQARAFETELESYEAMLNKDLANLAEKSEGDDEELARLEERRREVTGGLEPALLQRYERVLARGNDAVVPVIAGICQGCFMALTPQLAATMFKDDEIVFCPTCARVLYREGAD